MKESERLEKMRQDLLESPMPKNLSRGEETIHLLMKRSDLCSLELKIARAIRLEKLEEYSYEK